MPYAINGRLGINLGATVTSASTTDASGVTPTHTLGSIVMGSDGAEYMYVRADEAIAQYAAVKINDDFQIIELATADVAAEPSAIGVAQVAFADLDYGWVIVGGPGTVLCISAGSAAVDVRMHTTATAGRVDDVSVNEGLIEGMTLITAEGSGGGNAAGVATFFAANRMGTQGYKLV